MKYLKLIFKILAVVTVLGLLILAVLLITQKKSKSESVAEEPATEWLFLDNFQILLGKYTSLSG